MGIPGLSTQLHKYGTSTILTQRKCTDSAAAPQALAIIDGPALAHSIAHQVPSTSGPSSLIPLHDYKGIGKAAIRWLDHLRSYGFDIEGIYFDGALPSSKKDVRLTRLQNYVNRIVEHRQLHAQAAKNKNPSHDARVARILEKAKNGLPPPPFLVFAVVEALLASRYAGRTWLVNGEADAFCAAAAVEVALRDDRMAGSPVIFTNDSDLVLYDFEMPMRVAMINQMRESGSGLGRNVLEIFGYDHAVLGVKLRDQGADLRTCAFLMAEQKVTLADAIRLQGAVDRTSPAYHAFTESYKIQLCTEELLSMKQQRYEKNARVILLDSRISEPIHQDGSEGTDFYLPVLLDDTTRSTAWKIGSAFRRDVAQFIINQKHGSPSFLEYRRSGTRINIASAHSDTLSQVDSGLGALADQIRRSDAWIPTSLSRSIWWKVIILSMLLHELSDEDVALPSPEDIIAVLTGADLTTWTAVHLSAQHQAMFYSLRMWKQVHDWYEHGTDCHTSPSWTLQIRATMDAMENSPGIVDFFSVPTDSELAMLPQISQHLRSHSIAQNPSFSSTEEHTSTQQDDTDSEDPDVEDVAATALANNPFAMLAGR